MNKEELKEIIEKQFYNEVFWNEEILKYMSEFIFETIIPEVLKSVLWKDVTSEINWIDILDYEKIKQKVKLLYQIDL